MITFKIYSIGKTKEPWLETALAEYRKRLTGRAVIIEVWLKNDKQLEDAVAKESLVFCLVLCQALIYGLGRAKAPRLNDRKRGCIV